MHRHLLAALGATAVVLSGCAATLDRGVVEGKDYHAAYTTVVVSGKTPVPIYHPERWVLHLRDGDQKGYRKVTEDEYSRYEIGQWYP